jgi:alkylation response protein AidB-like acyl-CoA dehydrogenase
MSGSALPARRCDCTAATDFPIERYLRDVRVHQILEGTNEIMRVITARRLLRQ